MKKIFAIALTLGFLIGCGSKKTVTQIKNYINETNNRTDLAESITEFFTEDENEEAVGGISIYQLTDSNKKIYRIIAEIRQPNEPPANYEFYYKKDTLIFAQIIQFDEMGVDTIINSEYFYKGLQLIKQLDKKKSNMDPETVLIKSEYYLVYGKE